MEGIVVTGSRLPAAANETSQDVHLYDRERIENSGQTTVAHFPNMLPEVSLNSIESTNVSTTVRLRGAAQGTALILSNGRRTAPVTGSAANAGCFDLNTIPNSMILTSYEGDARIFNGFGRGQLLQLPAGSLDAVLGAEYENDKLVRGFEATRNDKAAFVEMRDHGAADKAFGKRDRR